MAKRNTAFEDCIVEDVLDFSPDVYTLNDPDKPGPLQRKILEREIEKLEQGGGLKRYEDDVMLFSLPAKGRWADAVLGPRLVGTFKVLGNNVPYFAFASPTGSHSVRTLECQGLLAGVRPVIDLFSEKKVWMVLCGHVDGERYVVNEVHTAVVRQGGGELDFFHAIGDQDLQDIIAAAVHRACPDKMKPGFWQSIVSPNKDVLELFYRCVRHSLEPHQRAWVEQSLLKCKTILGKEDRAQILAGVSYLLNIDWLPRTPVLPDLKTVQDALDREFYGMEKVKTRFLEVVAQIKRAGTVPRWGILLHGPAGTGKTTIAKAFARALGIRTVQLEMSTIDAEALTGTPRVFSNAKPSVFTEAICEMRDSNVMVIVNELDKQPGSGIKTSHGGSSCGDPSNTLLTLVDKLGFTDEFLNCKLPTDNVFFVATCNDLERISAPLRDRFLIIDIDPYPCFEKKVILEQFIFPKMLSVAKVAPGEISLSAPFVDKLCKDYALQPGVRDLEQASERIIGDHLLRCEREGLADSLYTAADLPRLFDASGVCCRQIFSAPGVVKTAFFDGASLRLGMVEASVRPGNGCLTVLGAPATTFFYNHCVGAAFEAVKNISSVCLDEMDVTVCFPSVPPVSEVNTVGLAVFIAILSAVTEKELPENAVFLGGCDLYGNLYWDSPVCKPGPVADLLERSGCTRLYGPLELQGKLAGSSTKAQIIGAVNAGMLFEII